MQNVKQNNVLRMNENDAAMISDNCYHGDPICPMRLR